ncbi:hypothetical protein G9A89_003640, partial [Geosiphon pyriformis]
MSKFTSRNRSSETDNIDTVRNIQSWNTKLEQNTPDIHKSGNYLNSRKEPLPRTSLIHSQQETKVPVPNNSIISSDTPNWTKSLEEYGSLFGNLTPTINKTDKNTSTWKPLTAQISVGSATSLIEGTAILQSIGSNDKKKHPELAPGEPSKMWTPIPSNLLPINQNMAYQDITKLEKFSREEDNTY